MPGIPRLDLLPEQALEAEFELIDPKEAKGRLSAEYIWAYPPGIPLLIPGERIEQIQGESLHSTRGRFPHTIAVVKDGKPLDSDEKL